MVLSGHQVQERIKKIWDAKLALTEEKKGEKALPRIVRLCRKLKLTEKEAMVMFYVIVWQMAETRNTNVVVRLVRAMENHVCFYTMFFLITCQG